MWSSDEDDSSEDEDSASDEDSPRPWKRRGAIGIRSAMKQTSKRRFGAHRESHALEIQPSTNSSMESLKSLHGPDAESFGKPEEHQMQLVIRSKGEGANKLDLLLQSQVEGFGEDSVEW